MGVIQVVHRESNNLQTAEEVNMEQGCGTRLMYGRWDVKGNCGAIYKAGTIIMRTESGLGRRCKAIVYREYKEGDVSA